MNDKDKERSRYNSRASNQLKIKEFELDTDQNSYMMDSIESYHELLSNIPIGSNILELGAGMGENTEFLLLNGHKVHATDISENSVEFMKRKYKTYNLFSAEVADMEFLRFKDNSFDIICSAGSLSYGDNLIVMNEIYRILNTGGSFIAVDSLNNNPIFRLNRYIHFLLGNRSKSTLKRMPNIKLIENYESKFGEIKVAYFGSLTWLFPLLRYFLNNEALKKLSHKFDNIINIKKSAFKFTMQVTKL